MPRTVREFHIVWRVFTLLVDTRYTLHMICVEKISCGLCKVIPVKPGKIQIDHMLRCMWHASTLKSVRNQASS